MEGGAARNQRENAGQSLLVIDQEVAGRGAHEYFHARRTWKPLEPRQLLDILPRGADEKGEVAKHSPAPARDLVGQSLRAHRCRLGVRHLEHGGGAAEHSRAAAGFQILFVLEPRLAEMHLRVDHAWQDMQAAGIEHPRRIARRQAADRGDASAAHANIGMAFASMIDEGRALDDEVECLGQE